MLTGLEIIRQVGLGRLEISPFDVSCVGPNSYDVRLGQEMIMIDGPLDLASPPQGLPVTLWDSGIVLEPGVLYLGVTEEKTFTPYHIPCLSGRSSIGRMGISVHITAGFGDIGFRGHWTLEISVVVPIRIYPGIRIGQLYFYSPEGIIGSCYSGKYQDSVGAGLSQISSDL